MRSERAGEQVLRAALLEHGGTVATLVDGRAEATGATDPGPAQIAASGPRAAGNEADYELLVDMIYEGSRLHYGPHRVVRTEDADLALLVGDQLYALGLSRLAALGDLEAVGVLADVIAAVAQAHAAADPEGAAKAWAEGARAVGWGRHSSAVRDAPETP
jgi:hypothetical protein